MNNNRSYNYENYMNSHGIREILHKSGKARMLGQAGSNAPSAAKLKQRVLRFALVVIAIVALLIFFSG